MTPEWVTRFFDSQYGALELSWSLDSQIKVAKGLKQLLNLSPGDMVFDQCCGTGGLGWGLARLDINSLGVDQSLSYIEYALKNRPNGPGQADFLCRDAFEFSPSKLIDGAVNWHSSFGYAGVEGGRRLIEQLRVSLKTGKRWLIEIPNLEWLQANFLTHIESKLGGEREGQTLYRQSKWVDGWLCQNWCIRKDNAVIWQQNNTRCWHFSKKEIVTLIEDCGDQLLGIYSDLEQTELGLEHPRMIVVVEKR